MRVGVDAAKIGAVGRQGAIAMLDYVSAHGLDGIFFRTVLDMSPTLDEGELAEIRAHADHLGLYLEAGVGWVNPYNTAETPHMRAFGKGDYRLAVERMIHAARRIDCTELWAVSGHSVHGDPPFVAYDRFRTDVSWSDQLAAMTKFIGSLAPLLRDLNCRLNLETHGDETSHELVRLIEEIGADVVGVTLDTGNLPLCADEPVAATRRLAPYVHMTHAKDGILFLTDGGLSQQLRPLGEGIVDWETVLRTLGGFSPDLNLSIEDYRAEVTIPIYDPEWHAKQPDLTTAELAELVRLARLCEERMVRGEIEPIDEVRAAPYGEDGRRASILSSAQYLRQVAGALGLYT